MTVQIGDKIIIASEKAGFSGREGIIEEVIAEEPPRYLVRWSDNRQSIITPSAGQATIKKRRTRATKPKTKAKTKA